MSGFAFKSADYVIEGVPLIKIGNIQNKRVSIESSVNYLPKEIITDRISKFLLEDNDVLIAMTGQGSVGRVGRINLKNDEYALLNQRVGKFICDEINLNIDYLFYVLTSDKYQDALFNAGSGSGQPNLSPEQILDFEIPTPNYSEQTAIAEVLSSLDNKIDLLHRQNKTLEQIAETLFRQWFVEEDSKPSILGDLAKVSTGKGLKRDQLIQNGTYPVIGANGEIGRTNNFLTEGKLIITGRVGTLGEVKISQGQVWISDNVLIIKPLKPEYFYPIYFALKDFDFENINAGSTQPLVTQTDLKLIDINIGDSSLREKFELQCVNIFSKIDSNNQQINTLTQLRDTLLPKLMSGEVRLENNLYSRK